MGGVATGPQRSDDALRPPRGRPVDDVASRDRGTSGEVARLVDVATSGPGWPCAGLILHDGQRGPVLTLPPPRGRRRDRGPLRRAAPSVTVKDQVRQCDP